MSTSFGDRLPSKIVDYLHFEKSERKNSVIFLLTTDPEGFPHVALLSPYQVVTEDSKTIYIAVHKGTRSQQFLESAGKGTLILQLEPAIEYIKFTFTEAKGWNKEELEVLYRAEPVDVLEDYSDRAPFISEMHFDETEIHDSYNKGFDRIKEFIQKA